MVDVRTVAPLFFEAFYLIFFFLIAFTCNKIKKNRHNPGRVLADFFVWSELSAGSTSVLATSDLI